MKNCYRWLRRDASRASHHPGFSLLEMMTVVAIIMIVAAIASPIYITSRIQAEEAVLHDHLFTLRFLINRFTLDHGRAPASLDEFVEKGYLGRIPTDPFTGSNETWVVDMEATPVSITDPRPAGWIPVFTGMTCLSRRRGRRLPRRHGV